MHQLQWHDLPQPLPPLSRRQVVAMYEDGVRALYVVCTQNTYVVDKRHFLILCKPDEVDDIRNDHAAVVFVHKRHPRVVQSVVDVQLDVDVLEYDPIVTEHYAETYATCDERSGDQQTAPSGHA